MHLIECDTISRCSKVNNSIEDEEFSDYNIITPLRFLLMKKKNPNVYEKLTSLVSNLEPKVCPFLQLFQMLDVIAMIIIY